MVPRAPRHRRGVARDGRSDPAATVVSLPPGRPRSHVHLLRAEPRGRRALACARRRRAGHVRRSRCVGPRSRFLHVGVLPTRVERRAPGTGAVARRRTTRAAAGRHHDCGRGGSETRLRVPFRRAACTRLDARRSARGRDGRKPRCRQGDRRFRRAARRPARRSRLRRQDDPLLHDRRRRSSVGGSRRLRSRALASVDPRRRSDECCSTGAGAQSVGASGHAVGLRILPLRRGQPVLRPRGPRRQARPPPLLSCLRPGRALRARRRRRPARGTRTCDLAGRLARGCATPSSTGVSRRSRTPSRGESRGRYGRHASCNVCDRIARRRPSSTHHAPSGSPTSSGWRSRIGSSRLHRSSISARPVCKTVSTGARGAPARTRRLGGDRSSQGVARSRHGRRVVSRRGSHRGDGTTAEDGRRTRGHRRAAPGVSTRRRRGLGLDCPVARRARRSDGRRVEHGLDGSRDRDPTSRSRGCASLACGPTHADACPLRRTPRARTPPHVHRAGGGPGRCRRRLAGARRRRWGRERIRRARGRDPLAMPAGHPRAADGARQM